VLESITLGELFSSSTLELPSDGGPVVDKRRLALAQTARGEEFDSWVLEVIGEAGMRVSAGYLRRRVGGPRWKLQAALGRLVDAGHVERTGVTSSTRYRLVEGA
jgi:hypothetical protein